MNATLANTADLSTTLQPSKNEQSFRDEYKYFLTEFLFPLFGRSKVNLEDAYLNEKTNHGVVEQDNDIIYFYAGKKRYFRTEATLHLNNSIENMAIAKIIIQSFLTHCSYAYQNNFRQQNRYTTTVAKNNAWKMVIQEGITRWIFGKSSNEITAKFFDILERWAVKTYEGKHVTLGFVVNPSTKKTSNALL